MMQSFFAHFQVVLVKEIYICGENEDNAVDFQGWFPIWQASQLHHLPSRLRSIIIINIVIDIFFVFKGFILIFLSSF